MKKLTFLVLLLSTASLAFASQEINYEDSWGAAGFSLTQRTNGGVNINFSIDTFTIDDALINGEDLQNILLPGNYLQNDEGAPNLPGNGRYIAIPQGAEAELHIINSRIETFYDVELAPAPRIPLETEDGPLEYSKNLQIFNNNAFFPTKPIQLGEKTLIRGVDAVMLGITPFQYNPITKELLVYRDLEIEVNFVGGNNHFGSDNLRSRWWDPIFADTFLNYESLPVIDYSMNNRNRTGGEYLIICPDDPIFLAWADSIKVFRTEQGISTIVKTTTEVGGNTTYAIESYINDIMDPNTGWDPAPAAVLLIGDYGTTGNSIVSPIYNSYCVSDNIYADVSGNSMPDVVFARMTAQNETHLETMITKFLDYERTPPTNPGFYNNPITALGYQTERWFQICSETVAGYWEIVLGKTVNRINAIYTGNPITGPWSTNQNTSMVMNYFGPDGLGYIPATPGEVNCTWNGNANDVINGINSGAFILQHRDHGSETGWGEPAYQSSHINSQTNTDLTFIFSINCLTGKYNIGGECFAEKFHRYTYNGQNSGALGLVAASEVSYSFVNDTYVWGAYDNMWPDFMPDYGSTPVERGILPAFGNAAGKYFLQQSSWPYNTGNKEVTYNLFHHHGDAFTTIYSEIPQDLTINHEPIILSGISSFNVTADTGALISLSVNGTIIGIATGTGSPVAVTIDPQIPPTDIKLVITKQNYFRYEAVLPVIPPGGPFVVFNEYVIDDAAGNGNGLLDYGETVNLDMTLNNVGSDEATNVLVTITSTDPYITIIDGSENFGNIAAGSLSTINDAFQIEVADDVPDGHDINFELIAVGQDTWISYFSIEALAPILEYVEFLVNDTVTGNGDYMWDPGETVDIYVTVANEGSSEALNVGGLLSTNDPFVTINTTAVQAFGDINAGNDANAAFTASSDANTPEAHLAQFIIDFTADLGITGSGSFETQIGGYLIEEYFETFPPTGWTTEGGNNWQGNNGNSAGGESPEAQFNWSPSTVATQRLISQVINTTGNATLALSFQHMLDDYGGGYSLKVQTTSDGSTWNDAWSVNPTGDIPAELLELDVATPDVGSSTFQIAWVFDGDSWDVNNWYVDNVILGGGTSALNGTVAGFITDSVSGLPIEGADVAGMAISGADGSYTFDIVPGTYDFTCSYDEYYDLTMDNVLVEENLTTDLDFAMVPYPPMNPPANALATIEDFNDVVITWDAPATEMDKITSSKIAKSNSRESIKTKNSNNESTREMTGYKVYRDGSMIEEITDPAILTCTDESLGADEYEYYVIAVYDIGESDPSNISLVEVILPAPANLTGELQYPDVVLSWDEPTERGLASYKIYRDNVMIAEDVYAANYTDLNVPADVYIYQVKAVYDGDYESEFSNEAEVTVTEAGNNLIPLVTSLEGNYPNPFNPTTTIKFGLSEDSQVRLDVYNIKGEKIITLVDGYLKAEFHSIVWDGTDSSSKPVSSGVYFYKMQSEKYNSTKKMILMK